jgi:hypothetical protein
MVENRSQLDESLIKFRHTLFITSFFAGPGQADSADEIEPQHVLQSYSG